MNKTYIVQEHVITGETVCLGSLNNDELAKWFVSELNSRAQRATDDDVRDCIFTAVASQPDKQQMRLPLGRISDATSQKGK